MTDACDIMRWYNEQAKKLFYFTSEDYQFEMDVKEIYFWLEKDSCIINLFLSSSILSGNMHQISSGVLAD